ncbi:uncharacterized protein ASPGLDRAFT_44007, partial [Aspergillus glaucus CBS 516.65]
MGPFQSPSFARPVVVGHLASPYSVNGDVRVSISENSDIVFSLEFAGRKGKIPSLSELRGPPELPRLMSEACVSVSSPDTMWCLRPGRIIASFV